MADPGKWYGCDGWMYHDYKARPLLIEMDFPDLALKMLTVYHHPPDQDVKVSRWMVIPE